MALAFNGPAPTGRRLEALSWNCLVDEERSPSKFRVVLVVAGVCAAATGVWVLFLALIGRLHSATHGCYDIPT